MTTAQAPGWGHVGHDSRPPSPTGGAALDGPAPFGGYLAPGALSRATTAGRLRKAGFGVVHSPTKTNRLHVSVYPPLTEAGEPAEWDDELASRFNACFT